MNKKIRIMAVDDEPDILYTLKAIGTAVGWDVYTESNSIAAVDEVEKIKPDIILMNRISIICLGVKDMAQSIRFYRDGLGFATDEKEDSPKVVFFNTTGTKFELYPLKLLAEDINEKNPPHIATGFAGITLAYNVKSEDEVHG